MSEEELRQLHDDQDDFFTSPDFEEPSDSEEEVFSFEQLRDAFVRFRDSEDDEIETQEPFSPLPSPLTNECDTPIETESGANFHIEPEKVSDDASELTPRTVLEAMLFVGDRENRPMTSERAAQLMRNVSPEEVDLLVEQLNERYVFLNKPYHIQRVDDGYRMMLQTEFDQIRTNFYGTIRKTRLSQAAIDVLAIVAYKQPISCEEIQKLRKASSSSVLSQLVKRGLLEAVSSPKVKRTPLLYQTTDRFLKLFKMGSLSDLPLAEDIVS